MKRRNCSAEFKRESAQFSLLNNSNLLMGCFLQWLNIYLIYAVFDVSLIQRQGDIVFLYVDGYDIARK